MPERLNGTDCKSVVSQDASGVQIPFSAHMKTKNEIITFLKNETLLEWKLSCASIDWKSILQAEGSSMFFGVGLCTSKEPVSAVPFDILAFFLEAEKLRRFFDLKKIIVLIADRHALTNPFMSREQVDKLGQNTISIFERVIRNFNLQSFEIRKASVMLSATQLNNILPPNIKRANQYLVQEIADVIWMITHDNLALKLGWSIDSALEISGHDERFFDLTMKELLPRKISFLFTTSGRTFDKHRQKASPYISIKGEHRLLLTPGERVEAKLHEAEMLWSDKHFGGARKHLANIIRSFEELFGHLPGMPFEQKLQHIVDVSMKGVSI